MASPHSEAVYCLSNTSKGWTYRHPYAGLSIASATISVVGSLYMLAAWGPYLKVKLKFRRPLLHPNRHVVFFLALSDVVACLAVISRSITLLFIEPAVPVNASGPPCTERHPEYCNTRYRYYWSFGIVVELTLRFGYTATFLWTLLYACDACAKARQRAISNRFCHLFTWPLALALAGANEIVLFAGNLGHCSGRDRLPWSYFLIYAPMLIVIVVNPLLYVKTNRRYVRLLRGSGHFTRCEREAVEEQQRKFLFLVSIFYICWLPSLISGGYEIAVLFNTGKLDHVPLPVWLVNAAANPLQGLLNSIVYGTPGQMNLFRTREDRTSKPMVSQPMITDVDDDDDEDFTKSDSWTS